MALSIDFRLDAIPAYIVARHGSLRALTPDEEDVLYVYGERVFDYIVHEWPVDTGTSQDAFSFFTSGDPAQGYGITVENPMYYAEFVHRAGEPAEPPLWESLFPEAWAAFKPALLEELKAAIDRTERRIAATVARGESRREAGRRVSSSPVEAILRVLNPLRGA